MIIDKNGKIFTSWWSGTGLLIEDNDNKYGIPFKIGTYYTEKQRSQHLRIDELKRKLAATDYRAVKFAEGEYTAEQYAPYKEQREAWRAEINEIEKDFIEPTLTKEEIERAESIAMDTYFKMVANEQGGGEDARS